MGECPVRFGLDFAMLEASGSASPRRPPCVRSGIIDRVCAPPVLPEIRLASLGVETGLLQTALV